MAFLIQAALLAGVGVVSMTQPNLVDQASREIAEHQLPSTRSIGRVDTAATDFRSAQLADRLAQDAAHMSSIERDMAGTRTEVADAVAR